jgi:hypothetical protein
MAQCGATASPSRQRFGAQIPETQAAPQSAGHLSERRQPALPAFPMNSASKPYEERNESVGGTGPLSSQGYNSTTR